MAKKTKNRFVWHEKYWNFVFAVLGIMGLVFGYWGLKQGKEIADESAAFQRGDLSLAILDNKVNLNNINLFYRIPKNCPRNLYVDLPLTIGNTGESPISSAELSIGMKTIEGASGLYDESLTDLMEFTGPIKRQVNRTFQNNGKWAYVYYDVENLAPGMSLTVRELLPILAGTVRENVKFTSKDGVPMSMDYELRFGVSYSLVLAWNNFSLENYTLTIMRVDADSKEEAFRQLENNSEILLGAQNFLLEMAGSCESEEFNVLSTQESVGFFLEN